MYYFLRCLEDVSNVLAYEVDIICPYVKVWLGIKGDNTCGWTIVGFVTIVLHDRLVLGSLGVDAP